MSLADVIDDFVEEGELTVKRKAAGAWVDGLWVPGAKTTSQMELSVQPVSGHEVENLPAAQHGKEIILVYSRDELIPRVGEAGDLIVRGGSDYEVFRAEDWRLDGELWWVAHAAKVVP